MGDNTSTIITPAKEYRELYFVTNNHQVLQALPESNLLCLAARTTSQPVCYAMDVTREQLARVTNRHHYFFTTIQDEGFEADYDRFRFLSQQIHKLGGHFELAEPIPLTQFGLDPTQLHFIIKDLIDEVRQIYPKTT